MCSPFYVEPVRKPHCWFSHEAAHFIASRVCNLGQPNANVQDNRAQAITCTVSPKSPRSMTSSRNEMEESAGEIGLLADCNNFIIGNLNVSSKRLRIFFLYRICWKLPNRHTYHLDGHPCPNMFVLSMVFDALFSSILNYDLVTVLVLDSMQKHSTKCLFKN